MLAMIVILWTLFKLHAPVWCYALIATSILIKVFNFGATMYKRGMEQAESEE